MNPILLPWGIEFGLITWKDLRSSQHRLPAPSEFLATSFIFGALAMVPQDSEYHQWAMLAGWGLLIASLLSVGTDKSSGFYGLIVNPTNDPRLPGFVAPPHTELA